MVAIAGFFCHDVYFRQAPRAFGGNWNWSQSGVARILGKRGLLSGAKRPKTFFGTRLLIKVTCVMLLMTYVFMYVHVQVQV